MRNLPLVAPSCVKGMKVKTATCSSLSDRGQQEVALSLQHERLSNLWGSSSPMSTALTSGLLPFRRSTMSHKFSSTEQLGSHRAVVERISEIQISDDQLFGVTATKLKFHKLHFIYFCESITSSLVLFCHMKDVSRVATIAFLISLRFRIWWSEV